MAETKTGVVQNVEYTHGGAGNQYTTIDGVRYVTFWDIRTRDWKEGDTVTFTAAERSLWHGQAKSWHAQNIKKVPAATAVVDNALQARLVLDVTYALNGVPREEMLAHLRRACERAIGTGMLSGETEAEVDEYQLRVENVPAQTVKTEVR